MDRKWESFEHWLTQLALPKRPTAPVRTGTAWRRLFETFAWLPQLRSGLDSEGRV
jgi:hypothetical protein